MRNLISSGEKYLFAGIDLALLTLAIYLAVGLMYSVLVSSVEESVPAPVLQQKESMAREISVEKSLSAYSAIVDRNIFGVSPKVGREPVPQVDLTNLKKTDLALTLLGTISGMGEDSYAVIEDTQKRSQGLYKIGDSVSGAVIKLILRKKVVLTINGRDEVLEMTEDMPGSYPEAVAGNRRPGNRGPLYPEVSDRAGRVRNVALTRRQVEDAFTDVNDLMKNVRIRPHFSNGKPDGLMLSDIAPDSIFREMGLENSDVIVGVNGKEIQTVDDCMDIYRNLTSSEEVMLEIKRGGKREFIQYAIR